MATITISIPDKDIEKAIRASAEASGYEMKPNFKVQHIINEMCEDVLASIESDLEEFFDIGIGEGCYLNVLVTEED